MFSLIRRPNTGHEQRIEYFSKDVKIPTIVFINHMCLHVGYILILNTEGKTIIPYYKLRYYIKRQIKFSKVVVHVFYKKQQHPEMILNQRQNLSGSIFTILLITHFVGDIDNEVG